MCFHLSHVTNMSHSKNWLLFRSQCFFFSLNCHVLELHVTFLRAKKIWLNLFVYFFIWFLIHREISKQKMPLDIVLSKLRFCWIFSQYRIFRFLVQYFLKIRRETFIKLSRAYTHRPKKCLTKTVMISPILQKLTSTYIE